MTVRRWASSLLVGLGLLQTVGYLSGITALRGIGAASVASPLPLVFSDVKGLETFASNFYVVLTDKYGSKEGFQMTPKLYGFFPGPYNRRNVYGAAISYGPRLKEEVWKSVLRYAFCKPGVFVDRMKIGGTVKTYSVTIVTKTAGRKDKWELVSDCEK